MKIDIEGADLDALSSLAVLERTNRPAYVSIESNKRDFSELRREFDALCSLGYTRFQVVGQRDNYKKTTTWVDQKIQRFHIDTPSTRLAHSGRTWLLPGG